MQFTLIDRILELEPGRRIVAVKNLTLAEEYLAEHFPGFPVLPGVLMLEAAAQASAWLIRVTEDYAHSVIVLKSAKAVRYGNFVTPGGQLSIDAKVARMAQGTTELQVKGTLNGLTAVSGRLTMESYNLKDRDPALCVLDAEIVASMKKQFLLLARARLPATERAAESARPDGPVVTIEKERN